MAQRRKSDLRKYYRRVAERAGHRCEYCRAPEIYFSHRFSVDHVVPESRSGPTAPSNLALCCYGCQLRKKAFEFAVDPGTKKKEKLFNPRRQRWKRHFRWSEDASIIEGLTPIGRATVNRLALNNDRQVKARKLWKSHPELFP